MRHLYICAGFSSVNNPYQFPEIHSIRNFHSNLDGFNRKNLGFFIEHKFRKGAFDLTPGLYTGYYENFGWNGFPGIDMGYSLMKNLRIYINAGRAFRVPDFYDMYYDSPVEKGNPDLVPERTVSYELGARYLGKIISGELNVFRQSSKNLIDWIQVPLSDSTYYWHSDNITQISRTGLEVGTNFDFSQDGVVGSWIRQLNLNYDYIFSDLKNNGYVSRYVLENLKHQFIFGLEHKLFWKIYNHLTVRYNQREGEAGYWLIDSKICWENNGKPFIYLEATNLTNARYMEVMTPMPGRWIRIGVNFDFGF